MSTERPRRILVAADAFKGCLSSAEVATAIAKGLRRVWPSAQITERVIADGGEGVMAAVAARWPGQIVTKTVNGPLGSPVEARWWRADDGRLAVIEAAEAVGLHRIAAAELDPLRASTTGVGELIAEAAASGVKALWIGAGGTATVDGGLGALTALGWRALDALGRPVESGGFGLTQLRTLAIGTVPKFEEGLHVLCDVANPMLGASGAASVYGPQKGATPEMVPMLEAGLNRLCDRLAELMGRNPAAVERAGAAGGLAGGLWAALGAQLHNGFDVLAAQTGLDGVFSGVDLVITGEGRVDAQSRWGKLVSGVLDRAERTSTPVWIVGGQITEAAEQIFGDRAALLSISDGPGELTRCMADAPVLIERAIARAARLWSMAERA